MGYSPRYHIYTNEFPDQHSETDDWACVESEMRRAKESGAIKADYAAYVIDTHTGQRTYFDSTGVKSPHGGRPMTLREVMDAEAPAQPPCSECATLQEKLEIAQRYGQREYAIEQILRGDLSTAVAECATLCKERDDYLETCQRIQGDFERAKSAYQAAEAQLSTLRDALEKGDPPTEEELAEWRREIGLSDAGPREAIAWLNEHFGVDGSDSLRESVTSITTCYRGHNIGARFVDREGKAWRLSEIMQAYAEFRAALAPTPEVAKE